MSRCGSFFYGKKWLSDSSVILIFIISCFLLHPWTADSFPIDFSAFNKLKQTITSPPILRFPFILFFLVFCVAASGWSLLPGVRLFLYILPHAAYWHIDNYTGDTYKLSKRRRSLGRGGEGPGHSGHSGPVGPTRDVGRAAAWCGWPNLIDNLLLHWPEEGGGGVAGQERGGQSVTAQRYTCQHTGRLTRPGFTN